MEDRRRFSRIAFSSPGTLITKSSRYAVTVLDVSLKGALLELGPDWQGDTQDVYILQISLSEAVALTMDVRLVHLAGNRGGFECERIDVDSLTHLRRLAELNLGDADLLQREIAELLESS